MTLPRRAEAPPSGVPSWARVGAKVVCVDDQPVDAARYIALPKAGVIYTIRDVEFYNFGRSSSRRWSWGLHLVEVRRFVDGEHVPFGVWRFRPLITKSQDEDIAEFRKLLTGQPVRENERA